MSKRSQIRSSQTLASFNEGLSVIEKTTIIASLDSIYAVERSWNSRSKIKVAQKDERSENAWHYILHDLLDREFQALAAVHR